ncbi:hypothetical protein ACTHGU_05005 [Chitinophagaceae bacterium MMS25-I14]
MHGITFSDYAATCAYISRGIQIRDLLPLLGITEVQWEEVRNYWENVIAMDEDAIFRKKYAHLAHLPVTQQNQHPLYKNEDGFMVLHTHEDFVRILELQAVAAKHGIDNYSILESEGISLREYEFACIYYRHVHNNILKGQHADAYDKWLEELHLKYRKEFEEQFIIYYNQQAHTG